jgi:hypothetical protein
MIQLYTALIHANVSELEAKNVLTELENTIHNDIERELLKMNWTSPFFSDRFLSCFFVVQFSIFLWTFIS